MLLLAMDTATPATTVAVHDGTTVLARRTVVDARRHAEVLAPAVAEVLAAIDASVADLTLVACGVGPGPYTGLRVGVVTARVLALSRGIPVVGVCTLDAIAAGCGLDRPFGVATDARRREVYWAEYDGDRRRVRGPRVNRPADVAAAVADVPFVGDGALAYPDAFLTAHPPRFPDAGDLAGLVAERLTAGDAVPAATGGFDADDPHGDGAAALPASLPVLLPPTPLYLRRPDAAVPGAPKRVTA